MIAAITATVTARDSFAVVEKLTTKSKKSPALTLTGLFSNLRAYTDFPNITNLADRMGNGVFTYFQHMSLSYNSSEIPDRCLSIYEKIRAFWRKLNFIEEGDVTISSSNKALASFNKKPLPVSIVAIRDYVDHLLFFIFEAKS